MTVPVIVLSHGKHVSGLRKSEFKIEEDGQNKPIASFEEIDTSSSQVRAISPPPGIYTNEVVREGPANLTAIVLDLINTPFVYQDEVKRRLLDYLQTGYRPDHPTMLAVLDPTGLRVLHDFTSDPKVLEELVHRIKNRGKHDLLADARAEKEVPGTLLKETDIATEYTALNDEFFGTQQKPEDEYKAQVRQNDLELTFSELQQLAHALVSVQGLKTMIWAFGRISLPTAMSARSEIAQQYQDTLKLMNAAGIVITPVDTYLETDNPSYSGAMYQHPAPGTSSLPLQSKIQIVQDFMDIAQRTGGDYCLLRRDRNCFRKMANYTSHYYLLTYYTDPSELRKWHKLHVTVHGNALDVRARNGYFSAGKSGDADQRRKDDIAQAVAAPVEYRALRLSVRWGDLDESVPGSVEMNLDAERRAGLRRRHKRPFQLGMGPESLTVDVTNSNHIRLDIVALALSRSGKVLSDLTQRMDLHPNSAELERLKTTGFIYSNMIELPSTATKVRFIVRDDLSERVGTVSMPVEQTTVP